MKKTMLLIAVLMPLCSGYAAAQTEAGMPAGESAGTMKMESDVNSPGQQKAIDYLVKTFNADKQTIIDLRNKKYGYGEISTALAIAQKSGKPLSEIVALKDSGKGWGDIAKKYGFKVGDVKKQIKAAKDAIRGDVSKSEMNQKPEKPKKMMKQKKMDKPAKPNKMK